MSYIWNEIQAELISISSVIGESFNRPASESEIISLEKHLGSILPASFKEYLRIFNGQKHNNFEIPFIGYNSLLPVSEILDEWDLQMFLFKDEDSIDFITENKVQPKMWDKGWVPFADFMGNSRLVIDVNPGKNGVYGQILQMWNGQDIESDNIVIAESFSVLAERILDVLKSGEFELEEGVVVLNNNWII